MQTRPRDAGASSTPASRSLTLPVLGGAAPPWLSSPGAIGPSTTGGAGCRRPCWSLHSSARKNLAPWPNRVLCITCAQQDSTTAGQEAGCSAVLSNPLCHVLSEQGHSVQCSQQFRGCAQHRTSKLSRLVSCTASSSAATAAASTLMSPGAPGGSVPLLEAPSASAAAGTQSADQHPTGTLHGCQGPKPPGSTLRRCSRCMHCSTL